MPKNPKVSKRVRRQKTAPLLRPKALPRGRPFPKGNTFGSEFRFVKNVCPNPGGRAKSSEISKALRRLLETDKPIEVQSLTGAEVIALEWYRQARAGNLAAIVSVADRAEGRPAISVGITDANSGLLDLVGAVERVSKQLGPPEGHIPARSLKEADLEGEVICEEVTDEA